MKVGYARASTTDSDLSQQLAALEAAGCERIFRDSVAANSDGQPSLQQVLDDLDAGDELVVWRLDRLARSLSSLVETVGEIQARQINLHSLDEDIKTTAGDSCFFEVFRALANFQRHRLEERTEPGLKAARARGRLGGRPRALDESEVQLAYRLYDERKHSIKEICDILGISKPTLYSYLREREEQR